RDSALVLSDSRWDWLVVDHYALDLEWERSARASTRRILVIDDLADRQHDCDILLDQNAYADMELRYADRVPASCERLLGPSYALLRAEFGRSRNGPRVRTGNIERVFVFFGGVDAGNYTSVAIEALVRLRAPGLLVDVVIGEQHPNRLGIESACRVNGFTCHVETPKMAELMSAADLAIGASGSTSWERCCVGLPSICVSTALNQAAIAAGLEARGAAIVVRPAGRLSADDLSAPLLQLMERPDLVRSLGVSAHALADGAGAQRVCDRLFEIA
ncbi:MAG: UDP-2,4-diacetamido-2,4,6-trideoxy-beta-L-altropyranose hydrolase, partial [Vicinamibacterales bacterium]